MTTIDLTAALRDLPRVVSVQADALEVDHLFVVCPAPRAYPVSERITVVPLWEIGTLRERIRSA